MDLLGSDRLSGPFQLQITEPLLDQANLIEHLFDLINGGRPIARFSHLEAISPPFLEPHGRLDHRILDSDHVLSPKQVSNWHHDELVDIDTETRVGLPYIFQNPLFTLHLAPFLQQTTFPVTKFSDFGLQALLMHHTRDDSVRRLMMVVLNVFSQQLRVTLLQAGEEVVRVGPVVARAGLIDSSFRFFAPISV